MIVTRGLSGIENIGNTCFMNSVLQSLSSTPEIIGYMLSPDSDIIECLENVVIEETIKKIKDEGTVGFVESAHLDEDLEENYIIIDGVKIMSKNNLIKKIKTSLTYGVRCIIKCIWSENCKVSPKKFKKLLDKHLSFFEGREQHDAQEFLSMLLDTIHNETKASVDITSMYENKLDKEIIGSIKSIVELNKIYQENKEDYLRTLFDIYWKDNVSKTKYSIINTVFSGTNLTETICKTCNLSTHRFEKFETLTISLPETVDETIDNYNMLDLIKSNFSENILNGTNQYNCVNCSKKTDAIQRHIIYHLPTVVIIMFKKYQKFRGRLMKTNVKISYEHIIDIKDYTYDKKEQNYELYSAIRHHGGIGGGHYYTYSKSPMNNEWYLYNDDDVFHVPKDEVLKCNGYVLFYRKC